MEIARSGKERVSQPILRCANGVDGAAMDLVHLNLKRNRGWPWPEASWGLDPMFGEDGWCRSCGTPLREQSGPLILERKGLGKAHGAWVPNWRFDTVCVATPHIERVRNDFRVELREVAWPRTSGDGSVAQIVIPTTDTPWFDPAELRTMAIQRHGTDGAECPTYGVWRWMPMTFALLPPPKPDPSWEIADMIASPE